MNLRGTSFYGEKRNKQEKIALSQYKRIKGILHLKKIIAITVNGRPLKEPLCMKEDNAGIFTFELSSKKVLFHLEWINYPSKAELDTNFFEYLIEAEKIHGDNIPDLFDLWD